METHTTMDRPLTLAHLIVGLGLTIAGGAFTAGIAWAGVTKDAAALAAKVEAVAVQRSQDLAEAKTAREQAQRDLNSIKWVTIKLAQKQGIDTSRLEQ